MGSVIRKLQISEKISLGFGLVGALFLIVIWQYHAVLDSAMADYQNLLDTYAARKHHVQTIERHILSARALGKEFIISREEAAATRTKNQILATLKETSQLAALSDEDQQAILPINNLVNSYAEAFDALVNAWRLMGLDHNSGLQGAFRNSVHDLESLAARFETSKIYLNLLQIRRAEKDLGLRKDSQYQQKVLLLIANFKATTQQSNLGEDIKRQLIQLIGSYSDAFSKYSSRVLSNQDIEGGKGPFRDIAHEIEALINKNYVPGLEENILQMRRREKDFLLRGDPEYVGMVNHLVEKIESQVRDSAIDTPEKTRFAELLNAYNRDFSALVEQHRSIAVLTSDMEAAVKGIMDEVQKNVTVANNQMESAVRRIKQASETSEYNLLWITGIALAAGICFAWLISRAISRPLRRMAGMLDHLAFEETTERMPHYQDGRDEVNAMAGSVNTIADHRQQFIQWWKKSMAEAEAREELQRQIDQAGKSRSKTGTDKRQRLERNYYATQEAKMLLLKEQLCNIQQLNFESLEKLNGLLGETHRMHTNNELRALRQHAQEIKSKLSMIINVREDEGSTRSSHVH
jgi:HAMP domain-containing protein